MTRDEFDTFCASLPGAIWADPAEGKIGSWTVGGKMFACTGSHFDGVSVKTDSVETAQMLIDAGLGTRAPYFHRSWLRLDTTCPVEEMQHRIAASYELITTKLPKKHRDALTEPR